MKKVKTPKSSKPKKPKKVKCGNCEGCRTTEYCGVCSFCTKGSQVSQFLCLARRCRQKIVVEKKTQDGSGDTQEGDAAAAGKEVKTEGGKEVKMKKTKCGSCVGCAASPCGLAECGACLAKRGWFCPAVKCLAPVLVPVEPKAPRTPRTPKEPAKAGNNARKRCGECEGCVAMPCGQCGDCAEVPDRCVEIMMMMIMTGVSR